MTQSSIPTCYFPSTVLFIDDSREFLMNFTLQLSDMLAYQLFDSPYDALESIEQKLQESDYLNQRCFSEYIESNNWPLTNQTINLDLAAIHSEVYNPRRFSEISVVVVDYAMPGMNGIEFCQRMENSSIKKILLTGQADEKTAIEAFNQGLIHRYIQKSDPNVTELIKESIHTLQQQYFQNMSDMIVKMLAVNSPNCLQDEKFSSFFKQLCEEKNIVEFYLTENTGSFLLLDDRAKSYCLIMKNEQDLKLHYDLALDNQAPQEVLDQLIKGERIPCFWEPHDFQSDWSDWATYLLPAKKLDCAETYYYVVVDNPLIPNIREEKILSYHDYLEQMDDSHIGMNSSS